jgi:hypothetical protein
VKFIDPGQQRLEACRVFAEKGDHVSRAQRMADDGPRTDADEALALHDTEISRSRLAEGVMDVVQGSHAVHGQRVTD